MSHEKSTCQICERQITANKKYMGNRILALHGYQRPWKQGWQSSSCFGAKRRPYEDSADAIPAYIEMVKKYGDNQTRIADEMKANPPATLTTIPHWNGDRNSGKILEKPEGFDAEKTIAQASFSSQSEAYAYEFRTQYQLHHREAEQAKREVKRMEKRLADWNESHV